MNPISDGLTDKAALRKQLRARRAAVMPAQRRAAAQQLVRQALRQRLLARRRRIGFYMPAKNEIDILPMLRKALRMGVACYLPVLPRRALVSAGRRALWFSRIAARASDLDTTRFGWRNNRYAIPEFLPRGVRTVRARQLDLLLTPLLGFDRQGWRIGMGGGYYDASLAFLKRRKHWHKPRLIGVAYAVQEVARAPHDAWDVPLQGVLNEREFIRARRI